MSITSGATPHGGPYGNLYDPAMPKTELMGVEALRKVLGVRVALGEKDGIHTIVTKHNGARAALVPIEWYRKAREALNEPTDL